MKNFGRTNPVHLRHRQIDRLNLRDWIRDCIDAGKPTPTDAEIMDRFGFEDPEQARTLLADLADQGMITIIGAGADRQVLLGRVKPADRAPAPRPVPSVVRPEAKPTSANERLEKVFDDIRRRRAAQKMADEAARQAAKAKAADAEQVRKIRQAINAEHAAIAAKLASAPVVAPSQPSPSPAKPARKPMLRADMTAAAIRNGIAIDTFIGMLLERGFESFSAEERAAVRA